MNPRQLFGQVWEVTPRGGRQRKMWGRRVDDILLDRGFVGKENKSFLGCVDECVS